MEKRLFNVFQQNIFSFRNTNFVEISIKLIVLFVFKIATLLLVPEIDRSSLLRIVEVKKRKTS